MPTCPTPCVQRHQITQSITRPLSLSVSAGCPLLTAAGLSGLAQLKNLEELELTNCPGSSPELLQYFSLNLSKCTIVH